MTPLPKKTRCQRCEGKKGVDSYIADSKLPQVCKKCWTTEEVYDHIQADITKAMKGLDVKQKQKIIRELGDAQKRRNRLLRDGQI